MDTLSDRVAALLARRPGLKQAGLARLAGVSTASVSDWMGGFTGSMSPEPARRLSIEFGCDQNWLMTGIGGPAWREPSGSPALATSAPMNDGAPPTVRQALVAIRNRLASCSPSQTEAIGEALKLMAAVPDSERAFEQALSLLMEPPR